MGAHAAKNGVNSATIPDVELERTIKRTGVVSANHFQPSTLQGSYQRPTDQARCPNYECFHPRSLRMDLNRPLPMPRYGACWEMAAVSSNLRPSITTGLDTLSTSAGMDRSKNRNSGAAVVIKHRSALFTAPGGSSTNSAPASNKSMTWLRVTSGSARRTLAPLRNSSAATTMPGDSRISLVPALKE